METFTTGLRIGWVWVEISTRDTAQDQAVGFKEGLGVVTSLSLNNSFCTDLTLGTMPQAEHCAPQISSDAIIAID